MIKLIFAIDEDNILGIVDEKYFKKYGCLRDYCYNFIDIYLNDDFAECLESGWEYVGKDNMFKVLEDLGFEYSQELQDFLCADNKDYLNYVAEKELLGNHI